MRINSLPRHALPGLASAWSHPYGHSLFSPVLYADGGDGGGDGSGSTGGADAGQSGADGQQTGTATGAQQGTTGQAAPAAGTKDDSEHAATVARLEKDLAAARKEAASSRVGAKQTAAAEAKAELAQQIGKALGLVADDTPPDPAELTKQITTQTGRITELESSLRAKEVELAVHGLAEKHQAKVSALLDSRSFVKAIRELDPAGKDFTTQLDTAIKKAVTDNPSYRTAPQVGRSGADITGGPGETGKARPTSLGAAIGGLYGKQ